MRGNRFAALTQFTESFLDTVVAVQRLPVGHSAVTFLPQIWQVLVKGGPEGYDLEQHRLFAYAEEQIVRQGAKQASILYRAAERGPRPRPDVSVNAT